MRFKGRKIYPKSFRIKGEEYNLKFVDRIGGSRQTMGECRPEPRQIVVSTRQDREETLKTVIHELLHAMEFEYEIKIKHKTVYQLEEAIYDFIKENL